MPQRNEEAEKARGRKQPVGSFGGDAERVGEDGRFVFYRFGQEHDVANNPSFKRMYRSTYVPSFPRSELQALSTFGHELSNPNAHVVVAVPKRGKFAGQMVGGSLGSYVGKGIYFTGYTWANPNARHLGVGTASQKAMQNLALSRYNASAKEGGRGVVRWYGGESNLLPSVQALRAVPDAQKVKFGDDAVRLLWKHDLGRTNLGLPGFAAQPKAQELSRVPIYLHLKRFVGVAEGKPVQVRSFEEEFPRKSGESQVAYSQRVDRLSRFAGLKAVAGILKSVAPYNTLNAIQRRAYVYAAMGGGYSEAEIGRMRQMGKSDAQIASAIAERVHALGYNLDRAGSMRAFKMQLSRQLGRSASQEEVAASFRKALFKARMEMGILGGRVALRPIPESFTLAHMVYAQETRARLRQLSLGRGIAANALAREQIAKAGRESRLKQIAAGKKRAAA